MEIKSLGDLSYAQTWLVYLHKFMYTFQSFTVKCSRMLIFSLLLLTFKHLEIYKLLCAHGMASFATPSVWYDIQFYFIQLLGFYSAPFCWKEFCKFCYGDLWRYIHLRFSCIPALSGHVACYQVTFLGPACSVYSKPCFKRPLPQETTSLERPQFSGTN